MSNKQTPNQTSTTGTGTGQALTPEQIAAQAAQAAEHAAGAAARVAAATERVAATAERFAAGTGQTLTPEAELREAFAASADARHQQQEDNKFAEMVADRVMDKVYHSLDKLRNADKPTPEQRLAEAKVDEQVKAIQRKGEFNHALKIGTAWVFGAIGTAFGITLASAAAMRVSKNKLGIDMNQPVTINPTIVTDPGTAQMLLEESSRTA